MISKSQYFILKEFCYKYEEFLIPSIFILGLVVAYFLPEHSAIGAAITTIPGIVYSISIYPKLIRRYLKGKWQILLFLTGIIAFLVTILAEKELNSQYSIETSYLNNSPIILGAIYTPIWTASIVLGAAAIFLMIKNTLLLLLNRKTSWRQSLNVFIPLIPLFLLILLLEIIPKNLNEIVLLTDAYSYSDCQDSATNNSELFIRKNNEECYQITNYKLSIIPTMWTPKYSIIKSKKL